MNFSPSKRSYNVLVYCIFFLSGISGLMYETVWLRMLSRIVGNTVYASSIVLSAFMLGLSLGSFFIGKRVDQRQHLLRFYAFLEFSIAITAFLVFFSFRGLIPLFQYFHSAFEGHDLAYRLIQGISVFLLMVLPTFMMGATLPVLSAEAKRRNPALTSSMGKLYGINTLGAVFGVLLCGFVTLGAWGELNTVYFAVALNVCAGIAALWLRSRNTKFMPAEESPVTNTQINFPETFRRPALIAYFIIGFSSFALELVWTRLFQVQVGTSIYAFSMVLAIYLFGSALGSLVGGKVVPTFKDPLRALSICLSAIALYTLIGCFFYVQHVPQNPGEGFGFSAILLPFVMVFPITFLLGLIFPLVMQLYVQESDEVASRVGMLYALNTFGCILGSLLCGYVLIRFLGTRGTIIFLSAVNLSAAFAVYYFPATGIKRKNILIIQTTFLSVCVFVALILPDPFYTIIKKIVLTDADKEIFYHKEGIVATTTSFGSKTNALDRQILINGIGMTALVAETKVMSHLPMLLHPNPKKMLVICFGMGTAVRSALSHTETEVDAVELVGEEYEAFQYYHKDAKQVLANKRLHAHTDDGRNFLLMTENRYDVIVLDPAPPLHSAGTVNLYTSDFFKLCKSRLTANGIMCLWIPPDIRSEVKMIMRSFKDVFPNAPAFTGPGYPGFYLLGSDASLVPDSKRFAAADQDPLIMGDLNEWEPLFKSSSQLLDLQICTSEELTSLLKNVPSLSDNNPYTEFPLWRSKTDPEYKQFFSGQDFKKKYPN